MWSRPVSPSKYHERIMGHTNPHSSEKISNRRMTDHYTTAAVVFEKEKICQSEEKKTVSH